jgi:hypothetical protein
VTAALITIGTVFAQARLGPTQFVVQLGFWGFAVFAALFSWFFFYVRINNPMLLGDLVRAWKLDLPKYEVANRYSWLLFLVACMDAGLALRVSVKGVPSLGGSQPEVLMAVLLFAFVAIYLVAGPVVPILRHARRTVGANCFLSYATEDRALVERLRDGLESRHISCFQDKRHVLGGDELAAAIGRGIATSDVFLVVLSNASVVSAWVRDETFLALHYERLYKAPIVIPIRICSMEVLEAWRSVGDDVGAKMRARSIVDLEHVDDDWGKSMDQLREILIAKTRSAG